LSTNIDANSDVSSEGNGKSNGGSGGTIDVQYSVDGIIDKAVPLTMLKLAHHGYEKKLFYYLCNLCLWAVMGNNMYCVYVLYVFEYAV
jgi:hypothetical protein